MLRSRESASTADFSVQVERFFNEWNVIAEPTINHGDHLVWQTFFNDWRKYESPSHAAPVAAVAAAAAVAVASVEPGHFAEFAQAFPDAFEEYRRTGATLNVWRTARLGNDEVRNCKVLATFLNHTEDHGQGADILCSFLSTIGLPEFAHRASRERYHTHTEVWPLSNADSRVDIEIEGDDFLIFIEVKIAANEADGQLERYVELARAKGRYRTWAVIYLTPDGRKPANSPMPDICRIKSASWAQVSRSVRSGITSRTSSPIRHLLLQYAEFVAKL